MVRKKRVESLVEGEKIKFFQNVAILFYYIRTLQKNYLYIRTTLVYFTLTTTRYNWMIRL